MEQSNSTVTSRWTVHGLISFTTHLRRLLVSGSRLSRQLQLTTAIGNSLGELHTIQAMIEGKLIIISDILIHDQVRSLPSERLAFVGTRRTR